MNILRISIFLFFIILINSLPIDKNLQQSILLQIEEKISALPGFDSLPGLDTLPGMPKDAVTRSIGSTSNDMNFHTFSYAPNIDINKLLPLYSLYVGGKVSSELTSKTNLSTLPISPITLNYKSQRLLMPVDQKLKVGDGFDVNSFSSKASPFFLSGISQKGVSSEEGQDGDISISLATTAKELAESLSVDASAWGSGWGASVKASFSYSKDYKMKSNEVILIAKHRINLGKALVDPNKFTLTDDARKTLATNAQAFKQAYGTHFIAGYSSGCSLNIFFKKIVSEKEDKTKIAASLEASYSGLTFSGGLSVSTSSSKQSKELFESTEVSISYSGANKNAFIQNIDPAGLNAAILNFPNDCKGNIENFILWPYESAQSYVFVANEVDYLLKLKVANEQKSKLADLQTKLQQQAVDQKIIVQKLADETDRMNKEKEQQILDKKKKLQDAITTAKEYISGMDLLDDLFTKAIIESKIITIGLEDEIASQEKATFVQEEKLFQSKLFEVQMNFDYKKYQKEFETMQTNGQTKDFTQVQAFLGRVKQYVEEQRTKMITS